MKFIALLLVVALPAYAADDAPLADLPGTSVHLATGQPAPFDGRLLSDAEHVKREKIDAYNSDLVHSIVAGDVVVVSKPAFYGVIAGGALAVVTAIVLSGLAAAHKI